MELMELAQRAAEVIAPVLPFLNIATGELMEKAKEHVQKGVIERATKILHKVLPFLKESERSEQLVKDVAANPDNPALRGALAYELSNVFRDHANVAQDVENVLATSTVTARDITQIAGDNSQQIGVIGSVNIRK